jgi:uncharacterized membrane protein YcjF (UPF0283 family)
MDADQFNEITASLPKDMPGVDIFCLSIMARQDQGLAQYCHWDKLIDWSYNHLAGSLKERFVMALRERLDLKHKQAAGVVAGATTAAAVVDASPIPFSDAALLVPVQTGMIIGIAGIYGIHIGKAAISAFAKGCPLNNTLNFGLNPFL